MYGTNANADIWFSVWGSWCVKDGGPSRNNNKNGKRYTLNGSQWVLPQHALWRCQTIYVRANSLREVVCRMKSST